MASLYAGKRALITGGKGFLASHLAGALAALEARVVLADRGEAPRDIPEGCEYREVDLQDRKACLACMQDVAFVFHLAAVGWGFHENLKRQPELLTENLLLNTTVLDCAYHAGVERYLYTSSSAVYPGHLEILEEDASWELPPHPGEACFGQAKRMGEIQAKAYFEHYGFPVAIVRPTNPYGPKDNFHPQKSHVIPALIRRALSGEEPFTVWGSGRAIRNFIHARDVTRGMLLAMEKAADATPINLGSEESTSVADLVRMVLAACSRKETDIRFDLEKPDGHPRKVPSMRRASERLGLRDFIPLEEGLQETVQWYLTHQIELERTL